MGTGVSSSWGWDGPVTESQWAVLSRPDPFEGTECRASAGTGTRQAVVAAGTAVVRGVGASVSGTTLVLAENTSGQPRIDLVCLYLNWATNDASLVAVTGTPAASPSAPYASLSTTPGTAWHEVIAEVTVASGAGVLPATAVQDVRCGPWVTFTPESPWSNWGGGLSTFGGRRSVDGQIMLGGVLKISVALDFPYVQRMVVLPQPWWVTPRLVLQATVRHTFPGNIYTERIDVQAWVQPTYPNFTAASNDRWYSLDGVTYNTGQAA